MNATLQFKCQDNAFLRVWNAGNNYKNKEQSQDFHQQLLNKYLEIKWQGKIGNAELSERTRHVDIEQEIGSIYYMTNYSRIIMAMDWTCPQET